MAEEKGTWTRRRFLEMVGLAGGSAAVYETMTALGLVNTPTAWAGPPKPVPNLGEGKTVIILGAGIAGLTAAYELERRGFRCSILEAQDRAGGRSLTARHGTVITEQSEKHGVTHQTCEFDEGLYLNMGPGRIPYHHRNVIHYCRELGVPLEVYVMETTANLFQTPQAWNGDRQLNRRIANDTRGYIAEMLAKALSKKSLYKELGEGDRDRLLSLLKTFGDLGKRGCDGDPCAELTYCGSTRSGCGEGPTVTQPCCPEVPLELSDLLSSEFWKHRFYQPTDFLWQPTLFQPVGGMDQIVEGFKRKIGHLICYQSEVLEVELRDDGVGITYRDGLTGEARSTHADFCVSNIPLPVLQKVKTNFTPDFRKAVDRGRFEATCKVGWQAEERFWETEDEIYGGISWIDDIITQMWYPSNDYFSQKGTMTGTYNFDDPGQDTPKNATRMGEMSLAERLRVARAGAVRLHKQFADPRGVVPEAKGLSIAWQNIPFQRGGWAQWEDIPEDRAAYARLLVPDPLENPRFWVIGDQVSTLPGWQEGAMMSAHHAIEQILPTRRERLTVPDIRQAPSTRDLVDARF